MLVWIGGKHASLGWVPGVEPGGGRQHGSQGQADTAVWQPVQVEPFPTR